MFSLKFRLTALCASIAILFFCQPAAADRFEYQECMDKCKAEGSLSACFYNCGPYMDRPGPPPPPPSDLLFGAIALDAETLSSGFGKNAKSREDAEAQALAQCRKAGGTAAGCKVIIWRHNSCIALATSREGSQGPTWGYAYSDDGIISRREATRLCRGDGGTNCQIVISFCTG